MPLRRIARRLFPVAAGPAPAYEPALVPPLELMRREGIDVLEEWFRWGDEWAVLARVYAGLCGPSRVLEIGCGLGRVAFPLRYVLGEGGSYDGFEISHDKVDWLQRTFTPAWPAFRFAWADVRNTHYNPGGRTAAAEYEFPYEDDSFDLVLAPSVFTHMLPDAAANYLRETARVMRPGGRCLFSFFLLDNYRPGHPRPHGFGRPDFDLDHRIEAAGEDFALAFPDDPERMTGYRLELIERLAGRAGLERAGEPLPGLWSGTELHWIAAQDLVVLRHAEGSGPSRPGAG